MISERQVAEGFHAVWSEILPLLTPTFVRLFNGTYASQIHRRRKNPIRPLPLRKGVRHNDIVSEVAFSIVCLAASHSLSIQEGLGSADLRSKAQERTRSELSSIYKNNQKPFELSASEWREVGEICRRYELFFGSRLIQLSSIDFEPRIHGVGFIHDCRADFSVGSTLFEVKTIDRGIQSRDIRQLILYLALQAATGDRRWSSAVFFNPRRGLVYQFQVERFMQEISGGRSSAEVFADLTDFLTTRDVQIEKLF